MRLFVLVALVLVGCDDPIAQSVDKCKVVNKDFISCGERCRYEGGTTGQCIQMCTAHLSMTGRRCLYEWGPGF